MSAESESTQRTLAREVVMLSGSLPNAAKYLNYLTGLKVALLEDRLRILRRQGRRLADYGNFTRQHGGGGRRVELNTAT